MIRKNIPPFVRAAREPLTYAGINAVGLRRRGFSDEQVKTVEDIYRILYIQNNNVSKGLEAIQAELPDSDIKNQVIQFIKKSDKGIIRGPL